MVIFGIALVVLGPERIPEVAAFLGKWTGELKRMSDSVRREFYNSVYVPLDEPEVREEAPRSLKASEEVPNEEKKENVVETEETKKEVIQ